MAQEEHRMVFDIRGKRRHVVKFVYAILAVLMALSLFLVTGAVNLGSLFNSNGAGSNEIVKEYEQRAQRYEAELKKTPGDEELLAKLARVQYQAGGQLVATGPNGEIGQTVESRTKYREASNTWSEYLKASKEPNASLAQQMAGVLFTLAGISNNYPEANENLIAAAEAQTIYSEKRPTLNALSTQAIYSLFAGDEKEAEEANTAAKKLAGNKFQREQLDNTFESTKKQADDFHKRLAASEKAAQEAAKNKESSTAPESVEDPLGPSLGGGGLTE